MFIKRYSFHKREDGEKIIQYFMSVQGITNMLRDRGVKGVSENDVIDFLDNCTMTSLVLVRQFI